MSYNVLQDYLMEKIAPMYEPLEEWGHGYNNHICNVVRESLLLVHDNPEVDAWMVLVVAFYHDVGLWNKMGRLHHEKRSADALRADKTLTRWFTPEEIEIMAQAVEDHRSSNSSVPRSIYGSIIAEADRDLRPSVLIRRYIQANHRVESKKDILQLTFDDLNKKYGAHNTNLKFSSYRNQNNLEILQELLINKDGFDSLFEEIFDEVCVEYSKGESKRRKQK